jgi:hypothetical protein
VKLRSASLDDVYLEANYVLSADSGWRARLLLVAMSYGYNFLRSGMLHILRRRWRREGE